MPIFDLFSKRKRRAAQVGQPEIYRYEPIPEPFKVKIVYILRDAIGVITNYGPHEPAENWRLIHDVIAREKGRFELANYGTYDTCCIEWFMRTRDTEDALDFIDVSFRVVDRVIGDLETWQRERQGVKLTRSEAIEELNGRFREEALGYQFENGELIRIDNQYTHAKIVSPALHLLSDEIFAKANEDFMKAHEHYRHNNHKECIVAAFRAFESVLKAICTVQKWKFPPGGRASDLIKVVRSNCLFPDYLGNGFDSYIAMMKTGLPEVRNNAGGHGEAPAAPAVPGYIAGFALHMTAANIVLLGEAFKRIRRPRKGA